MHPPSNNKVLYDKNRKIGTELDTQEEKPEDAFAAAYRAQFGEYTEDHQMVDLYESIGCFYNMSWGDFMEVPYPILKIMKKKMDDRMINMKDGVLNYTHLALLLTMSRMFGSGDD